jgi:hypothetical protein
MSNDCCELIERINDLQKQIYKSAYAYKQQMSGLQVIIRPDQHKILLIRGYLLLDSQGNSVYVHFRVFPNQMVEIDSNSDMTGLTLYLF